MYRIALLMLSLAACAPVTPHTAPAPWPPVATFSILAYDSVTGEIGDVTVNARAHGPKGSYRAALTVPRTGVAEITIHTGFNRNKLELLPMQVIARGAPRVTVSAVDRGRQLFVAKGCIACHGRTDITRDKSPIAPDLTGRRYPAEYLHKLLADPAGTLTTARRLEMPNLQLKQQEIAAITTYINTQINASR